MTESDAMLCARELGFVANAESMPAPPLAFGCSLGRPGPLLPGKLSGSLGNASVPDRFSRSVAPCAVPCSTAAAAAVAYADSFSPIHDLANHRPPAMPRISRLACRQCRTFFPLLSSGITGAKPEPILVGGWTEKGFEGRGYVGRGTPSSLISSVVGAGAMEIVCELETTSTGSGVCSSWAAGEDAAVFAYAVRTSEFVGCHSRASRCTHIR